MFVNWALVSLLCVFIQRVLLLVDRKSLFTKDFDRFLEFPRKVNNIGSLIVPDCLKQQFDWGVQLELNTLCLKRLFSPFCSLFTIVAISYVNAWIAITEPLCVIMKITWKWEIVWFFPLPHCHRKPNPPPSHTFGLQLPHNLFCIAWQPAIIVGACFAIT